MTPQPLHLQSDRKIKWRDETFAASDAGQSGDQVHPNNKRKFARTTACLVAIIGLLALSSTHLFYRRSPTLQAIETGSAGWHTIEPDRALRWHACYGGELECARLDVPMDWLSQSQESRVILAVARLRAKVSHNDADYRGPVFFNPGGPGGSGIWSLKDHGALLQTIVGANHDIVTFDPRGIGASTPRVDCWGGDAVRRALWALQEPAVVDEQTHPAALSDLLIRASAFSDRCQQQMNGNDPLLAHISTASHARDMLEILDQMGQARLRYWGFSYGTVLGGTFAAMYPDRVERLVSDGNVDYREWHLGQHTNFLRDTDKVMDAFYEYCHLAGADKCAMYDATPTAIRFRVDSILQTLKSHPIIVSASVDSQYGPEMPFIVTYSRLKRAISSVLYRPIHKFEPFATVLSALEKDDGWPFWNFFQAGDMLPSTLCPVDLPPPPTNPTIDPAEDTDDAFPAIMCADAEPLEDSLEDMARYASELQLISDAAGAVNVLFRAACAGRTVRPKWRFSGPFEANTSFPILYIANIADNVTPLISARNNSAGFPGSVILVQNSYGHTTLAAPSTCTARHIRAYFQDGTLPPTDSPCEPDLAPFGVPVPGAVGTEDSELSLAIHRLSHAARWTADGWE